MKVVVAIDSFKNCLSSIEISNIIEKTIKEFDNKIVVESFPVSDGGENMADILIKNNDAIVKTIKTYDPIMREIKASYGLNLDNKTAYIDMSSASGIERLKLSEMNPLKSTTYGTGILIKSALNNNVEKIILGVGSSATVDLGLGCLQALGAKLYDIEGKVISEKNFNIMKVHKIDLEDLDKRLDKVKINFAVDVDNPLLGRNGAINLFGTQKGLSEKEKVLLEDKFNSLKDYLNSNYKIDIDKVKGAGAGGGFHNILSSLFSYDIYQGIELLLKEIDFIKNVENADLIITGEGFIDSQTQYGKVPIGVAKIGKKYNIPTIAISGGVDYKELNLKEFGINAVFSICNKPQTLEEAISSTEINLKNTIFNILEVYKIKNQL